MILGFSSGCLYKTHDGMAKDTIRLFSAPGCNAVEIMCHDIESIPRLMEIMPEDIEKFEYVSLHAPIFKDISEEELRDSLKSIEDFCSNLDIDLVVVHPDKIKNWKVFSDFSIPIAIENMDNRKESCKNVENLKKIFEQVDAKMVLDVNHCFSNDPSMKLAAELIEAFRDRIAEIHLSGFETFHDLLYKTQQKEILASIFDKNIPIIIESGCLSIEDVEKEYSYVKDKLK